MITKNKISNRTIKLNTMNYIDFSILAQEGEEKYKTKPYRYGFFNVNILNVKPNEEVKSCLR
jgi:hypothetical protein